MKHADPFKPRPVDRICAALIIASTAAGFFLALSSAAPTP